MRENILVIAVQNKDIDDTHFFYSMEEIKSLIETAKGTVTEVITQKRNQPHPANYLGSGKIAEVIDIIEGENIELRSEEHTSELQSRGHLVCRLLLEKKNK